MVVLPVNGIENVVPAVQETLGRIYWTTLAKDFNIRIDHMAVFIYTQNLDVVAKMHTWYNHAMDLTSIFGRRSYMSFDDVTFSQSASKKLLQKAH